jgi:DNA polymerase III subunit delta'
MAKRKSSDPKSEEAAGEALALHPRHAPTLVGHAAAEETFLRAFNAGALHHAWLVTGERGIGKATFAYIAARFLLSRDDASPASAQSLAVPASHPAARQIAAGAHPSLFVLGEADASSIGVDEVRRLRSFLGLTSPGGWRAMIVDPANDLTIASANALLKAVEEPPARTVFFLIGHGASTVMPTIRSRCVKLALRPLDPQSFGEAVRAACAAGDIDWPDAQALENLYRISAGAPGRAVEFLIGGLLPLAEKVDKILKSLPRTDYGLVHSLIQSTGGARNAQTFDRVCDLIEEQLEAKAREALNGAVGAAKAAGWARAWQEFRQRRADMDTLNLDKGAFLLGAFSDMESIVRKTAHISPA